MFYIYCSCVVVFQKRFIKRIIAKTEVDITPSSPLWGMFKFTRSKVFEIFIYVVIVMDMVNVGLAITSQFVHVDHFFQRTIFRSMNVGFMGVYVVEMILKVS